MNVHQHGPGASTEAIIKLAILAVGGQGGGVVTTWIVGLAEANGYRAQSTSVPGVAQRTGATIYYVEMVPDAGREPVFSLMPAAGDVDIVLAAELMEAGRAIQRGFVTPERTTLIASTHRAFATSEKSVPGDGVLADAPVLEAAREASARFVSADLESLAAANRSVISASLFGALAGAGVLPFERAAFEETIRSSGRGVEASLMAFAAGFDAVRGGGPRSAAIEGTEAARAAQTPVGARLPQAEAPPPSKREPERPLSGTLERRIEGLPEPARAMARRGLVKLLDYQDERYGREYLDRLDALAGLGTRDDAALTEAGAKYIANAMAYDDVIRVADLKVRSARTRRVRGEVGVDHSAVMTVTEYMHPRAQEMAALLPAPLGAFVARRASLMRLLERTFGGGRRVRTDRLRGFVQLAGLASLRPVRRRLLRHRHETAHLEAWLGEVRRIAPIDQDLAVEVLRCRRLVKGYSDTHARGLTKFDRVLSALPVLEGREDAAHWLRRLREAALLDEHGTALDGALKTVASLDAPPKLVASEDAERTR